MARFEGRLDDAETGYTEAMDLLSSVGSRSAILPQLNLALVLIHRREFDRARTLLEEGCVKLEKRNQRGFLAWARACLLPCEARSDNVDGWEALLSETWTLLRETSMVDPDVAWSARYAADLLAHRGRIDFAKATYQLAAEQWQSLGNEEAASAVLEVSDGLAG
jgi:tetratricopeptide (TPR) repeat protein